MSAADPLEVKPAWSEIPPIKHTNMSSGHFFKADWFLQYLSNHAQASQADLLREVSGKTLVIVRFRVLMDYRAPLEFTI